MPHAQPHLHHCPPDPRKLVLASSSPRRQELLSTLGLRFETDPSQAPETIDSALDLARTVVDLACRKAQEVAPRHQAALIIAADTLVSLDSHVLEKPLDEDDARKMLGRLSGRSHRVFTGVVVLDTATMSHDTRVVETEVRFRSLTDAEIDAYVSTGEPLDKAGAYGMQALGSLFVAGISGDYFNVIGLPLVALNELLTSAGCCVLCRRLYDSEQNEAS